MSTALPELPEPAAHASAARRAATQGSRSARAEPEDHAVAPCSASPHGAMAPSAAKQRSMHPAKARDSPTPAVREVQPFPVRPWCVPTDPPPI